MYTKIFFRGSDTLKFLQGLCTNDVNELEKTGKSIAAAFLTPKGRVLATAILHYICAKDSEKRLVIETDDFYTAALEQHLKRFKLRSKVSIKLSEMEKFFVPQIPTTERVNLFEDFNENGLIHHVDDPRISGFGSIALHESTGLYFLVQFFKILIFIASSYF